MASILGLGPPQGVVRWVARLPLRLYSWGLGGLLDHRFLQLTHIGRKSGLPRQTVLIVIRHDPATRTCIVASFWGEQSHWLRNIQDRPAVQVAVGGHRWPGTATILAPAAAEAEFRRDIRHHPWAARLLYLLLRLPRTGAWPDPHILAQQIAIVAVRPARVKRET